MILMFRFKFYFLTNKMCIGHIKIGGTWSEIKKKNKKKDWETLALESEKLEPVL